MKNWSVGVGFLIYLLEELSFKKNFDSKLYTHTVLETYFFLFGQNSNVFFKKLYCEEESIDF